MSTIPGAVPTDENHHVYIYIYIYIYYSVYFLIFTFPLKLLQRLLLRDRIANDEKIVYRNGYVINGWTSIRAISYMSTIPGAVPTDSSRKPS